MKKITRRLLAVLLCAMLAFPCAGALADVTAQMIVTLADGTEQMLPVEQVATSLGETVYFSKGAEKNMKITTTEDLDLFEVLLHTERTTWLK